MSRALVALAMLGSLLLLQPSVLADHEPDVIALDATGASSRSGACTTGTVTWTHVVGPNSNRVLVVFASAGQPTSPIARYAGTTMTNLASFVLDTNLPDESRVLHVFYLFAPSPGSNSVTVTPSAGSPVMLGGSISLYNVRTDTPTIARDTDDGDAVMSADATVSAVAGDFVVAAAYAQSGTTSIPVISPTTGAAEWSDSAGNPCGGHRITGQSFGPRSSPTTAAYTVDIASNMIVTAVAVRPSIPDHGDGPPPSPPTPPAVPVQEEIVKAVQVCPIWLWVLLLLALVLFVRIMQSRRRQPS